MEAVTEVTANAGALLRLALAAKNTLRGLPTHSPTDTHVVRRAPPGDDAEPAAEGEDGTAPDEPMATVARRLLRQAAEVPDAEALERAGILVPVDKA